MPDFFVWCAYCGDPHGLEVEVCPSSGLRVRGSYPDATTRPFVGTRIGDRYLIRSPIGEGGAGAVFEAERIVDGKIVAIKVLKPMKKGSIWRLRREARLASSIRHPNVCSVHEIGILDDGAPFLVMDRLLGETLRARLKRDVCLDLPEAARIFIQVLGALAAAHDNGIVHRDVTAQNIFLVPRGTRASTAVKLLDFGLSKLMVQVEPTAEEPTTQVTAAGVVVGTPQYMAPEQLRGDHVDSRVDLYACGICLYEALAGRRPFRATSHAELFAAMTRESFALPSELRGDLPPIVDLILVKALAANRDHRYTSAADFIKDLAPLVDVQAETATIRTAPGHSDASIDVDWSDGSSEEITAPRLRRKATR